jgi:hypothetical protein
VAERVAAIEAQPLPGGPHSGVRTTEKTIGGGVGGGDLASVLKSTLDAIEDPVARARAEKAAQLEAFKTNWSSIGKNPGQPFPPLPPLQRGDERDGLRGKNSN